MEQGFSALIFGKQLTEISLTDLQDYFKEPRTESNKLEFKSYTNSTVTGTGGEQEKEKKVLKTICAFLNSDGGILIWGAPKEKTIAGTKERVCQGDLTPTSHRYEKDAFIAKIANRIIPSPRNVLFHRIEDYGRFVYLFEVSASEYSPHQFEDVYYMRMDGQSVAAPHQQIETLFKRVPFNNLFFQSLEAHRATVNRLHTRINDDLRNESTRLIKACGWGFKDKTDTDFFELLYRILHFRYRCHEHELRSLGTLASFFTDYEYLIGHYITGFISLVQLVSDRVNLSTPDKIIYVEKLCNQSTYDELRLMLYYVLSRIGRGDEAKQLANLFNNFQVFDKVSHLLIYEEDGATFQNLVSR